MLRYSLTACLLVLWVGYSPCGSVCLTLTITGGLITDVNVDGEVGVESSASHGPAVNVGDPLLRAPRPRLCALIIVYVVSVY